MDTTRFFRMLLGDAVCALLACGVLFGAEDTPKTTVTSHQAYVVAPLL